MMVRKLLAGGFLVFCSLQALSQGRINVNINNFGNNKGSCIVCLYNSAKEFSGKGVPVECNTVPITNKVSQTSFEKVPSGNYAILVIHDANNNRKFDTNLFGIPKEGYGASQNKLPFAAAPKFEENKFMVADGTITDCTIKLRYVY